MCALREDLFKDHILKAPLVRRRRSRRNKKVYSMRARNVAKRNVELTMAKDFRIKQKPNCGDALALRLVDSHRKRKLNRELMTRKRNARSAYGRLKRHTWKLNALAMTLRAKDSTA